MANLKKAEMKDGWFNAGTVPKIQSAKSRLMWEKNMV